MLSKVAIRENYKGPDRRAHVERRVSYDRRDLFRFESFGLDVCLVFTFPSTGFPSRKSSGFKSLRIQL